MTPQDFLQQLTEHLGFEPGAVKVESQDDENQLSLTLVASDEFGGQLIGHHGETLDSMQRLVRTLFGASIDKKIVLNINDYRERRAESLAEMTKNLALRVLETGETHTFRSYLPAAERYVVHTTISQDPELSALESVSEGEGRMRRISIRLKQS